MRVNITSAMLEKHGYTAGCRRCTLLRTGRTAAGVKHTEPCRDRIESRLRAEGDESMTRADARVNEHLADRVQEAESGPSGAPAGTRENLATAPPLRAAPPLTGRARAQAREQSQWRPLPQGKRPNRTRLAIRRARNR